MTTTRIPRAVQASAFAVLLGVGVGACGGSVGSPAKAGGAGPTPSTAEPTGSSTTGTSTGTGTGKPGEIGVADQDFDQAASQLSAAGDCASMCKALASMRKAAEHLCALTKDGGDDDKKRCDGAQEKLKSAETKVKSSCGGCGP